MKALWARIVAFFMTIIAFFSGLFGFNSRPADPPPEPTTQTEAPTQSTNEWLLTGVPAFGAGIYSTALYNTGTGLDHERITNETPVIHPTESMMQLVRETKAEDVASYCSVLSKHGYMQTFHNRIESNDCYGYSKQNSAVYFYYNSDSGETRVINDCCNTVSYNDFSYSSSVDPETALQPGVYQFSYPYQDAEHTDEEHCADSGMLYIILLSDGKVILIDGGEYKHSTDQNAAELWRFLHVITRKEADAPITVAMWYATHCHSDHMYLFNKLLHDYHEKLTVERLMFNFQSDSILEKEWSVTDLLHFTERFCPDAAYIKARSGYRFQLQDASCEVLYTQEDAVRTADASWTYENANDISAVLKVTIAGKSFLFLGDSNQISQTVLLKKYTAATLRADVVQAAHHLYNDLPDLYSVVQPTYVFCPQSKLRAQNTPMNAYITLRKSVSEENFFFANLGIVYGLTPQPDGSFVVSETTVDCNLYDGTYNC